MEKNRKKKIVYISILLVAIVGLTIGFSVIAKTLVIKPGASYKVNSEEFEVKFSTRSNEVVTGVVIPETFGSEGVEALAANLDNSGANPLISGMGAKFTQSGQKLKYTFYVANTGKATAYLKGITYNHAKDSLEPKSCVALENTDDDEVQEACNGITLTVNIGNVTTQSSKSGITDELIEEGQYQKVEVIVEYAAGSKVPNGDFKVSFGSIELSYAETK